MITGSLVAIVTPMHEDGRLDLARFKQLIDWHVSEGTDGIVVVGTTTAIIRAKQGAAPIGIPPLALSVSYERR